MALPRRQHHKNCPVHCYYQYYCYYHCCRYEHNMKWISEWNSKCFCFQPSSVDEWYILSIMVSGWSVLCWSVAWIRVVPHQWKTEDSSGQYVTFYTWTREPAECLWWPEIYDVARRPHRQIAYVNSVFHPSGVGKCSTSLRTGLKVGRATWIGWQVTGLICRICVLWYQRRSRVHISVRLHVVTW